VIGNSSYRNVPSLPNPRNDAAEIASLFRSAGFSAVDARRDLGISDMRRAISDFAEMASDADVAVVYFAGHGIEVDGATTSSPSTRSCPAISTSRMRLFPSIAF